MAKEDKNKTKKKSFQQKETYSLDALARMFAMSKLQLYSYYIINNIDKTKKLTKKEVEGLFK